VKTATAHVAKVNANTHQTNVNASAIVVVASQKPLIMQRKKAVVANLISLP